MSKYLIKLTVVDFLKCQTVLETRKVFKDEQNYLKFSINKSTLNKLDTLNINYSLVENYQKNFFAFLSLKRGFIVGIFLMLCFFLLNSFRINSITFNNNFLINEEIKEIIDLNTVKLFNQRFISNKVLKDLNKKVLEDFVSYEYISIKRNGTKLNVIINKDELQSHQKKLLKAGDLVAKKSGIVKYFNVYDGKSLLYLNKSVKKDDILVSSNLLYGLDLKTEEIVSARGYVVCEILEYADLTFNKVKEEFVYTDKQEENRCIDFFNKSTCKAKTSFTNYDTNKVTTFNFFNIFKINKLIMKEKTISKKVYTKDEIIHLAKESVTKDFNLSKQVSVEEIISIHTISLVENRDNYELRVLIKKLENIAKFQETN